MSEILYHGRPLQVIFEGRMSVFKPRLIMNDALQRRMIETLRCVAPEIDDYAIIVCQWRAMDHPTGQRGGYCEYSTRTIYLEDVGRTEDRRVWNRVLEIAIHELAHLVHGPSGETHGVSWMRVFAELLARAHQTGVFDYRLAREYALIGDGEYRRAVMALVEQALGYRRTVE